MPYAVRRISVGVAISSTNTKYFFVEKKIVCRAKIDGEQRTVYSNKFVSFSQTIFYSAKVAASSDTYSRPLSLVCVLPWLRDVNPFISEQVLLFSSMSTFSIIVYSGLYK